MLLHTKRLLKIKTFFLPFVFILVLNSSYCLAQEYIRTKEGRSVLDRRHMIISCLKSLNKDRSDKTAVAICECEMDKLDGYFTNKQYQKYTHTGIINIAAMIKEDTAMDKMINQCYASSGQTMLLQAEGFESDFISNCAKSIQKNTEKILDTGKLKNFCSCQLQLIKTKKITDEEMEALHDPNSLLFYEMIYKCGDPFMEKEGIEKNWTPNAEKDIRGPGSDTVRILSLNGMTYVKIKVGSMVQIWLFDTGASDLLINTDMEATLKKENIITEAGYLGIGQYEMANGMIDTCRKYRISNVQIGNFTVDNIIVAVTEKGKRIIVGKGLLNKFSKWVLNNRDNTLILSK